MNPFIARAIAGVAALLSIASIWAHIVSTSYGSSTYWDASHHAMGITILVLAVLADVGVILGFLVGAPVFDRLWLLAGMAVGGFLLFIPINFAGSNSLGQLQAGGWLGVASLALFVIAGVLLPLSEPARPSGVAAAEPTTATAAAESTSD